MASAQQAATLVVEAIGDGQWPHAPELAYPTYVALLCWRRAAFSPAAELLDDLRSDVWLAGSIETAPGDASGEASPVAAAALACLTHVHAALERWHSVRRWRDIYTQYSATHGRAARAQPTHRWQLFALARGADRWADFSALRVRALLACALAVRLSRDARATAALGRWALAARALRHASAFGVRGLAKLLLGRWALASARVRREAPARRALALLRAGRGQGAALRSWAQHAAAASGARRALRCSADVWRCGARARALRTWRAAPAARRLVLLALGGAEATRLRGLRAWRAAAAARRAALRALRAALARLRGRSASRALNTWRARRDDVRARARGTRAASARAVRASEALGAWQAAVVDGLVGSARRELAAAAAARAANGALAAAHARWVLAADEAVSARASGVHDALDWRVVLPWASPACAWACGANGLGQLGVGARGGAADAAARSPGESRSPAPAAETAGRALALGGAAIGGYGPMAPRRAPHARAAAPVRLPAAIAADGAAALGAGDGGGDVGDAPVGARAPLPSDVVALGCGSAHSCWLTAAGELFVSGCGAADGADAPAAARGDRRAPLAVWRPVRARGAAAGVRIVALACGGAHSLALDAGGGVLAWGAGARGQLGLGDQLARADPTHVRALAGRTVVSVAAGGAHSLCLAADGGVFSWGSGEFHQHGGGPAHPQHAMASSGDAAAGAAEPGAAAGAAADATLPQRLRVSRAPASGADDAPLVLALAAGAHHSVAVCEGGELLAWGSGAWGQLGHGDRRGRASPTPVRGLPPIRAVACASHTAALSESGELWTWGANGRGQLGHGHFRDALAPRRVDAFAAARVVRVACGGGHTVAITADGRVHGWGAADAGQLGCGGPGGEGEHTAADDLALPRALELGARALALAAGGEHTLLVLAAGARSQRCALGGLAALAHADGGRASMAADASAAPRRAFEFESPPKPRAARGLRMLLGDARATFGAEDSPGLAAQ
jgi:alpha-tubulin suppressor-like RCC1 family protein